MGQASRTTKLLLDLGARAQGGANTGKRTYLEATAALLDEARSFYLGFFLAHADKFAERVASYSAHHQQMLERTISAHELLTWAEFHTVETCEHPDPLHGWNFSERFPDMPFLYRRSVIKDAIGKVKAYLSNYASWQKSGKKKGKPGVPGAFNHTTLYQGTYTLELDQMNLQESFVRLKVYTGEGWRWANYPVKDSRYFEQRRTDKGWEQQSPKLVLRPRSAELHFCQTKEVKAKKVKESKLDPDLVTVAVDLNVKNLAVITVRQRQRIIETVFVTDKGLDQQRYRHLKRISRKQWQTGKPVKGEHSNQQLWRHVRRMNEDAAHKVARIIAKVCAKYPGSVLLFERLRKIKAKGASKSRRMNRRQANQLRGKINQHAKAKAFAQGVVTVEVNPHGTSQYCSRCGAKGERFSTHGGKRIKAKWGKLFGCPVCHYEANADLNAPADRMCIAHSIGRGIGSLGKSHLRRPPQAAEVTYTPSPATGRGREACQRDTPAKTGRPGPSANEQTCESGGAIAGPRGDVPTRLTLRATPGELTCRKAEGTLTRRTEPGRRERGCRELSTILGNC